MDINNGMSDETRSRLEREASEFFEVLLGSETSWSEYVQTFPDLDCIATLLNQTPLVKYYLEGVVEEKDLLDAIKSTLVVLFEFVGFNETTALLKESSVGTIIEAICACKMLGNHPQLHLIDIPHTLIASMIGGVVTFSYPTQRQERAVKLIHLLFSKFTIKEDLLNFFNRINYVDYIIH